MDTTGGHKAATEYPASYIIRAGLKKDMGYVLGGKSPKHNDGDKDSGSKVEIYLPSLLLRRKHARSSKNRPVKQIVQLLRVTLGLS